MVREEERLYSLFDTMALGVICQTFRDGGITYMNPAAQTILGLTTDELNLLPDHRTWGETFHRDNRRPYSVEEHPTYIAFANGQQVDPTIVGIRNPKDHSDRWLYVSSTPATWGEDPGLICSLVSDITADEGDRNEIASRVQRLKAIEKIYLSGLHAPNLEQMTRKLLNELLSIFDCHRVSLMAFSVTSGCKLKATAEKSVRNRMAPPAPLAALIPADICAALQDNLARNGVVCYDASNPDAASQRMRAYFADTAQMHVPLQLQDGQTWLLLIQDSTPERCYGPDERALLAETADHIAAALSYQLMLNTLRADEAHYRTLMECAPEAIFILDVENHTLVEVNENTANLFKRPREKLRGMDYLELSPQFQPDGRHSGQVAHLLTKRAEAGEMPVFEWVHQDLHGHLIPCEIRLVRFESADRILIRGSITDISQRKNSEAQMRKLSSALEQTADAIMITDNCGRIEYVNAAFETITGYGCKEVQGQTPRILKSNKQNNKYYQRMWDQIRSGNTYNDILINRKKDGSIYYEEKTITPLKNQEGFISHFISTGRDITERVQTQERLQYLTHHDPLTELPNRSLFTDRLEQAKRHAERSDKLVAVLLADLDHFKIINDTLGHDSGDAVLQVIAQRLMGILRSGDTIARLGGDEFAIILEDIADTSEILPTVETLLQRLSLPFTIEGHELFITLSIGISIFPNDSQDPRTLIKHADIAMHRAKTQGRNTYQFFLAEMSTLAARRLSMETKLRRALEREEFRLHYQPQVSLDSGKITGLEALLRWAPDDSELISPTQFIPILEETGLIVPVGEWVMETACRQLRQWRDTIDYLVHMSINVSSRQFNAPNMEQTFLKIIERTKIDPSWLEIEITESLLMASPDKSENIFKRFGEMGIGLAIDDFGTGYSSLSYLRRFPLNTLKVDRSFVRDITVDAGDAALISAIIAMAKSLRMTVIAEGVEDKQQLGFLKRLSCETAQGYLFYKPLPAEEIESLLKAG